MNRGAFFEAASELLDRIKDLYFATEDSLCTLEDDLCRKQDRRVNVDRLIRSELEMIVLEVGHVMVAFDGLCEAADQEPRFKFAREVLEASSLFQLPPSASA